MVKKIHHLPRPWACRLSGKVEHELIVIYLNIYDKKISHTQKYSMLLRPVSLPTSLFFFFLSLYFSHSLSPSLARYCCVLTEEYIELKLDWTSRESSTWARSDRSLWWKKNEVRPCLLAPRSGPVMKFPPAGVGEGDVIVAPCEVGAVKGEGRKVKGSR